MPSIYVLKCRGGKYYVGRTDKPIYKRYKEHLSGKGAAWTRKYKPEDIEETKKGDKFDEDKLTKEYMTRYGIENVRGGAYCQITLDKIALQALKREILGATDKCIKCGKSGHYAKNCKVAKKTKCTRCNREGHTESQCYATTYAESSEEEDFTDDEEEYYERTSRGTCYRCGRKGHYANKCYASTHVKGYYLDKN